MQILNELINKIFRFDLNPISPIDNGDGLIYAHSGDIENIKLNSQLNDYAQKSICPQCGGNNTLQNENQKNKGCVDNIIVLDSEKCTGLFDVCYNCGNCFFIIKEKELNANTK